MSYIVTDNCPIPFVPRPGRAVSSDAELEALKARYLAMLQQAEREKEAARQAKEELANKAAALDDIAKDSTVAKEETLKQSTQTILQAIEDKAVQINDITTEDINNLFA